MIHPIYFALLYFVASVSSVGALMYIIRPYADKHGHKWGWHWTPIGAATIVCIGCFLHSLYLCVLISHGMNT